MKNNLLMVADWLSIHWVYTACHLH